MVSIDQQLQVGKVYYYRISLEGQMEKAIRIQRFQPDVTKP
jgi:hypothetical protein